MCTYSCCRLMFLCFFTECYLCVYVELGAMWEGHKHVPGEVKGVQEEAVGGPARPSRGITLGADQMQGEETFHFPFGDFPPFLQYATGVFLFLSTASRAHAVTHKHLHTHSMLVLLVFPFNLAVRINRQTGRVFIYQLMSQFLNLFAKEWGL